MTKPASTIIILSLLCGFIAACQPQPDTEQADIIGIWVGEERPCGLDNVVLDSLPWIVTVEFLPNKSLTYYVEAPMLPNGGGDGTWSLSGDNITMTFSDIDSIHWVGTISDGKIEGAIEYAEMSCKGNWHLKKQ